MTRALPILQLVLRLATIAATAALLLRLGADPPPWLSPDFLLDEGYWLHNARSLVLFGDLAPGESNQGLVTAPLFTAAASLSFAALGVGFTAARLPTALATILTALLLGAHGRQRRGSRHAPWLFLASSFVLAYGHVAVVEPLASLLVVAAFATGAATDRRAAAAGVLLGLAVLAKPVAIPAIPALLLHARLSGLPPRRLVLLLGGSAAAALPVALPLLLSHRDETASLRRLFAVAMPSSGPLRWAVNALDVGLVVGPDGRLISSELLALSPALCLAAAAAVPLARRSSEVRGMVILLAAVLAPVALLHNRPGRRYLLAAAPVAWLAARALEATELSLRPLALVTALLAAPPATNLAWGSHGAFLPGLGIEGAGAATTVALLAVAALLPLPAASGRGLLALKAALLLAMTAEAAMTARDMMRQPRGAQAVSRQLAAVLDGRTVVGSAADTLCLENLGRSFRLVGPYDGRVWNGRLVRDGIATHGLMLHRAFGRPFPDPVPPGARLAREIPLLPDAGGRPRIEVRLYELVPAAP